jgi:hypothetical protein
MSKPKAKTISKKTVAQAIKQVAKIAAEMDKKLEAASKEMKEMVKVV